jgi:hypothetical protein
MRRSGAQRGRGHSRPTAQPGSRRRARSTVSVLVLVSLVGFSIPWVACVSRPPSEPEDICSIFRQKRSWHRGAKRSFERWGVPEAVQLAIIFQESSFRATARPPRSRFLWIFPGPRPSSAYGYGQVVNPTWQSYKRSTGRARATRDDFADVADFIGWYGDFIHRRTAIPKTNAEKLYLAYHEGPNGYRRGSHHEKGWLQKVSKKVQRRAVRYQSQYEACRESLSRRRFFGLF